MMDTNLLRLLVALSDPGICRLQCWLANTGRWRIPVVRGGVLLHVAPLISLALRNCDELARYREIEDGD